MAMARRDGRPLTVALADMDHFKAFNDQHGHQAGDQLLSTFASTVRRAMRASDSMARWGGEEFAISLPHCTGAKAEAVLDRLRMLTPLDQTCSIGCATWDGAESAEQLLSRVDAALYEAKNQGRNVVRRAGESRRAR
jgi:diguanylate cyclase (GGDEF)-like protein